MIIAIILLVLLFGFWIFIANKEQTIDKAKVNLKTTPEPKVVEDTTIQEEIEHPALTEEEKETLIKQVKLAIDPKYENWVLFRHSTIVIIEDTEEEAEIKEQGIAKMKEFGPVHAGGPAGDFGVISLDETKGWLISGQGYGMYTYVHPSELPPTMPEHVIGLHGRIKRGDDGANPEIICMSVKGKIIMG